MFRKVVVGVSGGVDSAVAALLLKNKGLNVQAVFLKNWDTTDEAGVCQADNDWIDAQFVCDRMKIPIQKIDFVKQYWNDVFGKFLKDYENGETPNPDINCNKYIKFNTFYHYAREMLSADAIATGHYANTSFGTYLDGFQENKNVKLLQAIDTVKDQTFFLSQISQEALRRTMFPIGPMLKTHVKQLASEGGLASIAQKHESMGICFVGKRNFKEFISEYIQPRPGKFIDIDSGEIIGEHDGIHYYTIGQNINLAGMKAKTYVVRKLPDKQTILVAKNVNNPGFFADILYTSAPHWIDKSPFESPENVNVVLLDFCFQHVDPLVNSIVAQSADGLIVKLDTPLRALTPGQYAVFYRGNECLGGAKITMPGPSMRSTTTEESNVVDNAVEKNSRKKQSKLEKARGVA